MSTETQLLNSSRAVDPYKHLQITPNHDGSIIRNPNRHPCTAASYNGGNPVLSKDIPVNQSTATWVRLFLPRAAHAAAIKLPLVVYIHGGGFIACSAANTLFHTFCSDVAAELHAVVASVDYRLAPEHRLPAAYDDVLDALNLVGTIQDEEWLSQYADLGDCYLMGSSAGANIAFHVALRLATADLDSLKVNIRGVILHHPFFGGVLRSGSELAILNDPFLPPLVSDLMWELSLPVGADRDHEYCNPTASGSNSEGWEKIKAVGWRYLVSGCRGDPLVDRQESVVRLLDGKGVRVESHFVEGGHHVVDLTDRARKKALLLLVKRFMESIHGLN